MTSSDRRLHERLKQGAAPRAIEFAREIHAAGGRAVFAGGWVRDQILGRPARDLDIEVFGLGDEALLEQLGRDRRVRRVGHAHPVWQVDGLDADIARSEEDFDQAARRRDLTINSMGWDPLEEVLLDPCGGRADLQARVLRACDPMRFGEDPLRALRVARFHAELGMQPEAQLRALCAAQDWSTAAPERVFAEVSRLLEAPEPGRGLEFAADSGQLRHLRPLEDMRPVPQDPEWHPEGDVWTHTVMVVDVASTLRVDSVDEDHLLMWGALCHDLGKATTTFRSDGRVRSNAHDAAGERAARAWLTALRAPNRVVDAVAELVRAHLAPALLHKSDAKDRAYRRLVRRLDRAGVTAPLLERLSRADHWGRTTEEALARRYPAGDAFLARVRTLDVGDGPAPPTVQGRHLLLLGIQPGPEMGEILSRCRDVQDETGLDDPEAILARVLPGRDDDV